MKNLLHSSIKRETQQVFRLFIPTEQCIYGHCSSAYFIMSTERLRKASSAFPFNMLF